ncbi:hypothetical protein ACFYXP_40190 [Streptomyces sp. NPDC002466]|uniref:hypothetical protein n=1 Tax=unclassified Streptomyces TaxID=2593676 RepID=UPI0035DD42E1
MRHRPGGAGRTTPLTDAREWLTVFLLLAYSPDLNPVESVWPHAKRSLSNLTVVALDRLEVLVRNWLKRLQYRPETLDGFIAGTGLTLGKPKSVSVAGGAAPPSRSRWRPGRWTWSTATSPPPGPTGSGWRT